MPADRDDRSTGRSVRFAPNLPFLLATLAVSLALGACSSLRLGYDNAVTLVTLTLDSYLDLDGGQSALVRVGARDLLAWHRATQLQGYVEALDAMQVRVQAGTLAAGDVRAVQEDFNARILAIGLRAAPDLARLARMLRPEQIERLAEKLAKDHARERHKLGLDARLDAAALLDRRVDRDADRASDWFGRLTDRQRGIIRASALAHPDAALAWLEEREQRDTELVALLQQVAGERPDEPAVASLLRDYMKSMVEPLDPARRKRAQLYRESGAELVADLVNSASERQRAALIQRLAGYASDFAALESARNG